MNSFIRTALAALAIIVTPAIAIAHEGHMHGAMSFSGAFIRAMPPAAQNAGGFLVITNDGQADDALLMVTSPLAGQVQLHETTMVDDMMQMGPIEGDLIIPVGESVVFEPGGLHLMFMQIETPFAEGDEVPVTLHFREEGPIDLVMPVVAIGASEAPMDMDHSAH